MHVSHIAGLVLVSFIIWNKYLHGKVFFTLNFAIDTTFEIIYCIFPLIYLTSDSHGDNMDSMNTLRLDLVSLGTLSQQNGFIIVQSLFAMVLLVRKCQFLLRDLEPTHIAKSHSRKVTKQIKTDHMIPWIKSKEHTKKLNKQGFVNMSELYRLVVARFESSDTIKPRTQLPPPPSDKKSTEITQTIQTTMTKTVASGDLIETQDTHTKQNNSMLTTDETRLQLTPMDNLQMVPQKGADSDVNGEDTGIRMSTLADKSGPANNGTTQNDHEATSTPYIKTKNASKCMECIRNEQFQRKSLVLCCGLMYIAVGLIISITFVSFIENDFKNKCLNYDLSNKFHIDHPELKFYTLYCNKQVVNMFSDYPCNCRQLSALNINTTEFNPSIVEASLERYDDLEGYFITQDATVEEVTDSNVNYTYTKSMLSHLVCVHKPTSSNILSLQV